MRSPDIFIISFLIFSVISVQNAYCTDFFYVFDQNYDENINLKAHTGLFIDEAPYEESQGIDLEDFINLEKSIQLNKSFHADNKRYWAYNKLHNITDQVLRGYLYYGKFDRVFIYTKEDSLALTAKRGLLYKKYTPEGGGKLLYDLKINPGDSIEVLAYLSSGIIRNDPLSAIDVLFVPLQNRLLFLESQRGNYYKSVLHIGLLFLIAFLVLGCLVLYALSKRTNYLLFIAVSVSLFMFYLRNLDGYFEQVIFWCHWPESLFQLENFNRTCIAISLSLFVFSVFDIQKFRKTAITSSIIVFVFSLFASIVRFYSVGPFIHVTLFAKIVYFLDLSLVAINSIFLIGLVWISNNSYAKRFVLGIGLLVLLSYLGMALNHTWLGQLDSLLSSKLYSTYGAMFFVIFTGYITIKKVYQTELDLLTESTKSKKLEELDKNRTRMLSNISHELRAPLTIINGVAEDLQGMSIKGSLIKKSSENLLSLVDGILDYSKYETGVISPNMIHGDVVSYLNYLTDSFLSLAEKKNVAINFHSKKAKIVMDYDETIMRILMSNLLSNSLKFTNKGGHVLVDISEIDNSLVWKVKDDGIGISPKEIHKIFDRFYQGSIDSSYKIKGTGIGLALVKELIDLLSGSIDVNSEIGKGTEFIIKIPISNHAGKETNCDYAPNSEQNIDSDLLVLIVEDNQEVREYIQSVISKSYNVLMAGNGREGLKMAIEKLPDLVISDVVMPLMNGYDLTRQLKQNTITEHIPVILLTGKSSQLEKEEGLMTGADAYVAKPFSKLELITRIDNLIDVRKLLHKKYQTTEEVEIVEESPWLVEFTDVVMQNLEVDIKIDFLCKNMLMSRTQLHRKITAVTGFSAMTYVKRLKLSRSKELMSTTDLSIAGIADKVGYKNAAHFSKDFRKFTNVSPSEFRTKV